MQPDLGINEVLDAVERELDLVAPHLRQWNQTYFRDARPRFINDLRTIERWYDSGEILEVGSLPYHLTMSLKMLGYEVIGLDLDPDRATQLIDRHQLRVEKCDIQHDPLPFADGSFGLVLLNEVFEHRGSTRSTRSRRLSGSSHRRAADSNHAKPLLPRDRS